MSPDQIRVQSLLVEVSSDGMEAVVRFSPAGETDATALPLTEELIRKELAKAGVTWGIDPGALGNAGEGAQGTSVLVAKGQPPREPVDARVELMFSTEEKVPVSHESEGEVDHRRRFSFTSVKAGELLARKHPPVSGTPGRTVRGEEVGVRPPRDVVLVVGRGAELGGDGMEVRATSGGRPVGVVKGNRVQVYVVPHLIHPHDVDMNSGHIQFDGDVKIGGSVLEGMRVEALGTVEVGGGIVRAELEAGNSVRVHRGVVASVVVAGGRSGHYASLLPLWQKVTGELESLWAAFTQVRGAAGTPAGATPGALLRTLLDSGRWRELPRSLGEFAKGLASLPPDRGNEEVLEAISSLKRILETPLSWAGDEWGETVQLLRVRAAELEGMGQGGGSIRCAYAVNATLRARGDIHVTGDGCHSSRLASGGNVRIERVFRGGEIEALGDVWVGELGAPGIPARVRVPAGGRVRLGQVAEDSLVQVGPRAYRFLGTQRKVGLFLNKEGEIGFFW